MKTMKQRILAVCLTLSLLITGIPFASFGLLFTKANAGVYQQGDIITFGSYPQKKETDSKIVSALNSMEKKWISYGYYSGDGSWGSMQSGDWMQYCDVEFDGQKYRGVIFTQYRPNDTKKNCSSDNSNQDENGYTTDTVYWFCYEPLTWKVLDPDVGLVLCEKIIDAQAYSNTVYLAVAQGAENNNGQSYYYSYDSAHTKYCNDYAVSSIRSWLNDDFYHTAFTPAEQAMIADSNLDNSTLFEDKGYDRADTTDKIFLLSYKDMLNSTYGFSTKASSSDSARKANGTDYAKCQGLHAASGMPPTFWWLRTPSNGVDFINDSDFACNVDYSGEVNIRYRQTHFTAGGVRPALKYNAPSGELDNGLTWEISDNSLIIRGSAISIPGFELGEAPWAPYTSQIEEIYLFTEYVETIGAYAFCGLDRVKYINIASDSLIYVCKYAFGGIKTNISVWFSGSEKQWKNVKIDYGNDVLIGSNIFCSKTSHTIASEHISFLSKYYSSDTFLNEHISFTQNESNISKMEENSFNNVAVIKKRVLGAYYAWDILGDVGEVVSLKFDDLTINADYYEMYLSDMILALNNEEEISKFEWKIAKNYNDIYEFIKKILKTSDEWDSSITPSMMKEIDNYLTGKSFEIGDNTARFLEAVFDDLYKNHKTAFVSVFEGLSTASTVLDGVFASLDIVNAFVDAYNAYIVSKSFYEVNNEFFDVCINAGQRLSSNSEYSKYGKWFLNAVYEAKRSELGNLDVIYNAASAYTKSGTVIVYDLFMKEFLKAAVYPTVANLLGLASAGQFSILTFTYNATYRILDALTGLSKASEQYKIINYITPVEKQLSDIVDAKRNTLLNQQSETNAISYDMAYRVLRQTNMYLYEAAYKHATTKNNTEDMIYATAGKNLWNQMICHNNYYSGNYNIFSSHCPVDVYIYDANGLLVTSIINETVEEYDSRITVLIGNGHKSFAYPAEEEFTFVIKAREEGTMDYSFGTLNNTSLETVYNSNGIDLDSEQEFSVTIPVSEEECSDNFRLITNGEYIDFDYESTRSCETHSFGEWIMDQESKSRVCTICGYTEYVSVCSHNFETVEVYSIIPTCISTGHTMHVCVGCGAKMNDGSDVAATGHSSNENSLVTEPTCTEDGYTTYTCSICGDIYTDSVISALGHSFINYVSNDDASCTKNGTKTAKCDRCDVSSTVIDEGSAKGHTIVVDKAIAPTCIETGITEGQHCSVCGEILAKQETIPITDHTDVDHDGKCDICGKDMTENCTCICHNENAFIQFIWKIVRFLQKLFGMQRFCDCGVAHW